MSHPLRRNGEPTIRETALAVLRDSPGPVSIYAVWSGVEDRLHRVLARKDIYVCLAKLIGESAVIGTGRGELRRYSLPKGK